jgi:hypothetical protein
MSFQFPNDVLQWAGPYSKPKIDKQADSLGLSRAQRFRKLREYWAKNSSLRRSHANDEVRSGLDQVSIRGYSMLSDLMDRQIEYGLAGQVQKAVISASYVDDLEPALSRYREQIYTTADDGTEASRALLDELLEAYESALKVTDTIRSGQFYDHDIQMPENNDLNNGFNLIRCLRGESPVSITDKRGSSTTLGNWTPETALEALLAPVKLNTSRKLFFTERGGEVEEKFLLYEQVLPGLCAQSVDVKASMDWPDLTPSLHTDQGVKIHPRSRHDWSLDNRHSALEPYVKAIKKTDERLAKTHYESENRVLFLEGTSTGMTAADSKLPNDQQLLCSFPYVYNTRANALRNFAVSTIRNWQNYCDREMSQTSEESLTQFLRAIHAHETILLVEDTNILLQLSKENKRMSGKLDDVLEEMYEQASAATVAEITRARTTLKELSDSGAIKDIQPVVRIPGVMAKVSKSKFTPTEQDTDIVMPIELPDTASEIRASQILKGSLPKALTDDRNSTSQANLESLYDSKDVTLKAKPQEGIDVMHSVDRTIGESTENASIGTKHNYEQQVLAGKVSSNTINSPDTSGTVTDNKSGSTKRSKRRLHRSSLPPHVQQAMVRLAKRDFTMTTEAGPAHDGTFTMQDQSERDDHTILAPGISGQLIASLSALPIRKPSEEYGTSEKTGADSLEEAIQPFSAMNNYDDNEFCQSRPQHFTELPSFGVKLDEENQDVIALTRHHEAHPHDPVTVATFTSSTMYHEPTMTIDDPRISTPGGKFPVPNFMAEYDSSDL